MHVLLRGGVIALCLALPDMGLRAQPVGSGRSQLVAPDVRTLWNDAQDGATISPNGKLVAFVDWNVGHIAVRDVSTGAQRPLTDKGIFARSVGFPEPNIVFSPRSDQVVYAFGNNETGVPFNYELRLVGMDTADQRVLARFPSDVEFVAPLDWHAEQGLLFTKVAADASSELLILRPEDLSVRVLQHRPVGSGVVYRALFAPDGRGVVSLSNEQLHHIETASGATLSLGVDAEALLGWSANGRAIVFHATRNNVIGSWTVPIASGRASGEPMLQMRTSAGVHSAGQTVNGVAYLEPVARPALQVVTLDIAGGKLVDSVRSVVLPADSVPSNPSWSRDGSRLAFTLRAPNRNLHRVIVSDGLDQPRREIARVDLRVMGLDWSRDGRFLVIGGRSDTRRSAWVGRINVATGAIERLVWGPVNGIAAGVGDAVAYVRAASAGERTVSVMVLPRPSATPRELASYPFVELPRSISVSPDGRWVAIVKSVEQRRASVLVLLPVGGGEPRTILRVERPDALELNSGTLPWTPDGTGIVILLRKGGHRRVAVADVASGALTLLPFATQGGGRRHPALHPDGRRMVYVDGLDRMELKLAR